MPKKTRSGDDRSGRTGGRASLMDLAAIDRWPRGIACDGGFKILGTPLGFAGSRRPGLLFLGGADARPPRRGQRAIATPFVASALGAAERELDALALGYGRAIRLGRMDLRLLPSGVGPGAAQLELGFRGRSIAYCDGVRLASPLHGPPAEVARCDLLLLDAAPADPRPGSPRRAAKRLAAWADEHLRAGPTAIVAGGAYAALDAAFALTRAGIPIRAVRPVFEMLRRVEDHGFGVPRLRRLEQRAVDDALILHLDRLWPRAGVAGATRGRVAFCGPGRRVPAYASAGFRLGESEDRPGLIAYAKRTGAAHIALGPRCDDATAELLARTGAAVYRVERPTQMPLPL